MIKIQKYSIVAILILLFCITLHAEVKLHPYYRSDMVLQRDAEILIMGVSNSENESVLVSLSGLTKSTVCKNGKWEVKFPQMDAGGPYSIHIKAENEIILNNILIGDVWLLTGQSNMQSQLKGYVEKYPGILKGHPIKEQSQIRICSIHSEATDEPLDANNYKGTFCSKWNTLNSSSAMTFSATGYFFGLKIQPELGIPVGMVVSAVGGTPIEAWIPKKTFLENKAIKSVWENYEKALEVYPTANADYLVKNAEYKKKIKENPELKKKLKRPWPPMGPTNGKRPASLFNGKIAPLTKFSYKGILWYQGEANAKSYQGTVFYSTLFKYMLADWRKEFNSPELPFIFVQLAAFKKYSEQPTDPVWAWMREVQFKCLENSNTAVVTAVDAGLEKDIHPPYKQIVGDRLADAALSLVYGNKELKTGASYRSMKINKDKAILEFNNVGERFIAAEKSLGLNGKFTTQNRVLKGFTICGADKVFYNAKAEITKNKVVVFHEKVSNPVAVRYAWANFPVANLYNSAGYPTFPFRTDTFEPLTK